MAHTFTLRPGATILGTILATVTTGALSAGAWLVHGAPLGWSFVLPIFALALPASVVVAHGWRHWGAHPLRDGMAMGVQSLLALVLPLLVAAVALGGSVASDSGLAEGTAAVLAAIGWLLVDWAPMVLLTALAAASAFWGALYWGQREFTRGLQIHS